jgi:hypothetical protein
VQGAAGSARTADEWVQAVGYAESVLESTRPGSPAAPSPPSGAWAVEVTRAPWQVAGLEQVTVTVVLPRGARLTVHRLERAP